jgi:hypothetical protein
MDVVAAGLERGDALLRLREAGVGLSATIHPHLIRAVTHLGISDDDVERAGEIVVGVLAGSRATAGRA